MHSDKVWTSNFMFLVMIFSPHYINTKPRATRKNSEDPFEEYVYSEF